MPAVLLDAMGTLVELEPPGPALRDVVRERWGLRVTAAEAEHAMHAEIGYYRAHHREGRDPASLELLRRRCAEVVRAELPGAEGRSTSAVRDALLAALRFRAFPDAAPALRELRTQGRRLVVVSNWDVSLPDVLARIGLAELVDGVMPSARAGADKPHAAIFLRALALAGVPPAEAIHVGDSLREDVAGARAAGVSPVLLARADPPPGTPAGVPVIASLGELAALAP
ncbi:MAG TPA: HAD-IA family hydrolase [Solirubrobacteraceae bacterium]|nr:HAD-IA family hydrolase [Solirubrobacteraceae bacterium]